MPTQEIGGRKLWTTEQVAAQLDIKPPALRAHIHAGHIPRPAKLLGQSYLWTWTEVQAARRELDTPGRRKHRRAATHAKQQPGLRGN